MENLFSFQICGPAGKLHIEGEGLGESNGVEGLSYYKMLPHMGPPAITTWDHPNADNFWALEMAAFLEDIRLGRIPIPGLKKARAALEVVEKIYRGSEKTKL